jgi:hypothetical protein
MTDNVLSLSLAELAELALVAFDRMYTAQDKGGLDYEAGEALAADSEERAQFGDDENLTSAADLLQWVDDQEARLGRDVTEFRSCVEIFIRKRDSQRAFEILAPLADAHGWNLDYADPRGENYAGAQLQHPTEDRYVWLVVDSCDEVRWIVSQYDEAPGAGDGPVDEPVGEEMGDSELLDADKARAVVRRFMRVEG